MKCIRSVIYLFSPSIQRDDDDFRSTDAELSSAPESDSSFSKYFATKKIYINCKQPNCDLSFKRQDAFDRHQHNVHMVAKKYTCTKENCNKKYITKSHLRRHIRCSHEHRLKPLANVKCSIESCQKFFTTAASMKRHYNLVHLAKVPGKRYACDKCNESFRRKNELRYHQFEHNKNFPYTCDKCDRGFLNIRNYRKHCTFHKRTAIKVNSCEFCCKEFVKWSEFQAHKKEHRPSCDLCLKSFSNKRNIKKHMQTHAKTPDQLAAFCCSYQGCGKRFSYMRNLRMHIRNKHDGHTFECDICGTALVTKQKMANHLQWHMTTGNRTAAVQKMTKRKKMLRKMTAASKLTGVVMDTDRQMVQIHVIDESEYNAGTLEAINSNEEVSTVLKCPISNDGNLTIAQIKSKFYQTIL